MHIDGQHHHAGGVAFSRDDQRAELSSHRQYDQRQPPPIGLALDDAGSCRTTSRSRTGGQDHDVTVHGRAHGFDAVTARGDLLWCAPGHAVVRALGIPDRIVWLVTATPGDVDRAISGNAHGDAAAQRTALFGFTRINLLRRTPGCASGWYTRTKT